MARKPAKEAARKRASGKPDEVDKVLAAISEFMTAPVQEMPPLATELGKARAQEHDRP